jgi:pimeloyl-ACP methyl ester carboxylesterase
MLPLEPPVPVVIDGTTIATRVFEPDDAPRGDVVLCHGTPWSSQVWGQVARELSQDYRVFVWDMPGYGESTKGAAVDLRTQAERLATLMDHWNLESPHMVAHDIGGAVALGAHLLFDVDYADLFLWDIVTLDPWGSPFFQLVRDNADVFAQLPPNLHSALVKEYIAGAVHHRLPTQDVDQLAQPWLDDTGRPAFYRQIAALSPTDTHPIVERLGLTRCPTRIGWGSDDPWIPLRQAYEIQSRLPGHPTVIELDGVAHLAPVENPKAVVAALEEWIA